MSLHSADLTGIHACIPVRYRVSRYADPPPVLRHWQLVLKYSGINEYSSRKLVVSGSRKP